VLLSPTNLTVGCSVPACTCSLPRGGPAQPPAVNTQARSRRCPPNRRAAATSRFLHERAAPAPHPAPDQRLKKPRRPPPCTVAKTTVPVLTPFATKIISHSQDLYERPLTALQARHRYVTTRSFTSSDGTYEVLTEGLHALLWVPRATGSGYTLPDKQSVRERNGLQCFQIIGAPRVWHTPVND